MTQKMAVRARLETGMHFAVTAPSDHQVILDAAVADGDRTASYLQ